MTESKTIHLEYQKESPTRIDKYLSSALPDISRSHIQRLIEQGLLQINENTVKEKKHHVQKGDKIQLTLVCASEEKPRPRPVPFDILHEDDYLLIVNKPAGVIVHPAPSTTSPTLVEGLLYRSMPLSSEGHSQRPGIIHRLDKETAGLLIVAKDNRVHKSLVQQMKERKIKRLYRGLLLGRLSPPEGKIETYYGRHPVKRYKMTVLEKAKRKAITFYRVLKYYHQFSLVEFELLTGRTHQIRVHMNYMGTPVIGDKTYGFSRERDIIQKAGLFKPWDALKKYPAHMLYASTLVFSHPVTDKKLCFQIDNPPFFEEFLEILA